MSERPVGFICTDENIQATQRRPTPAERPVIDAYLRTYEEATGVAPHGLHYLPFPDEPETVPVWFPPAG